MLKRTKPARERERALFSLLKCRRGRHQALVAASATTATATVAATAAAAAATAAAATVTAAATTATVATAAAGAGTIFTRLGLVHGQGATLEFFQVGAGDCFVGSVSHFYETEAAAAARFTIRHDRGARHRAELAEQLFEIGRCRAEREVTNVQLLTHSDHFPRS